MAAAAEVRPRVRGGVMARARRDRLLQHALIGLALLVFVSPIVWSISASLKGREELFLPVPTLFPYKPTLVNYAYTLRRIGNFPQLFLNSTVVTGGAVLLTVFSSALAGYAFGRIRFRGRDLIFYTLVLQLFIPRAGGLMAMYELMYWLGLRNSLFGLVLMFSGYVAVPIFSSHNAQMNNPQRSHDVTAALRA